MDKYYIQLLTQLIQGYHLNNSEIRDLEVYLKEQLKYIELIKEVEKLWYIKLLQYSSTNKLQY